MEILAKVHTPGLIALIYGYLGDGWIGFLRHLSDDKSDPETLLLAAAEIGFFSILKENKNVPRVLQQIAEKAAEHGHTEFLGELRRRFKLKCSSATLASAAQNNQVAVMKQLRSWNELKLGDLYLAGKRAASLGHKEACYFLESCDVGGRSALGGIMWFTAARYGHKNLLLNLKYIKSSGHFAEALVEYCVSTYSRADWIFFHIEKCSSRELDYHITVARVRVRVQIDSLPGCL